MALPILSRRRAAKAELVSAEDKAIQKAIEAVAGAFMQEEGRSGLVSKGFLNGNAAVMPGTSWSNQGTINNRLIARVTQNLAQSFGRAPEQLELALAEQGLSWGPPFPPGRPLDPFWGVRRPPRNWDFSVGINTQLTPRWNRISFPTLEAIINAYYAAQICIRHLINDVRSLDYQFVPPINVAEDASDDIEAAERWFVSPDKRQPFRAWLAEYLQDVLRFDAGCLYIRRNELGEPIALEVVSGKTMIPLMDFYGRVAADVTDNAPPEGTWPGGEVPGYLQIIEGLPWDWLTVDDIIYQPWNPLPDSQYGLAPMEAVLMQANTDMRLQWHWLQYFTEGSLPAGFMEAPPDLNDPAQVREWQDTWDAFMEGDQAKLRQIRWVPHDAKFTAVKSGEFNNEFALHLMRCTAAAFGVTPNDLGFTEDVNRSTGETQVAIQFRVGTLPLVRHVEDVVNMFIREHLHLNARIQFDIGREVEDRLTSAQAEDLRIRNGTISTDEARIKQGYRISRERPTPRFIDNTRSGPIPLLALSSLAGDIDFQTYGPAKGQKMIDHPFIPPPGVLPVMGSDEHKAAANSQAVMQENMLIDNADDNSEGRARTVVHTIPTTGAPNAEDASKALADALGIIGFLLEKDVAPIDNTGGPGVPRPATTVTGGITVDTNLQGVDLDDEDEDAEKTLVKLRQWQKNSEIRVRRGKPPRRFDDMPSYVTDAIWKDLEGASTSEEVAAAFASLGKAPAPVGA